MKKLFFIITAIIFSACGTEDSGNDRSLIPESGTGYRLTQTLQIMDDISGDITLYKYDTATNQLIQEVYKETVNGTDYTIDLTQDFVYNNLGQRIETSYSTRSARRHIYSGNLLTQQVSYSKSSGLTLSTYDYIYNGLNQLVQLIFTPEPLITNSEKNKYIYTYNTAGQLIQAQHIDITGDNSGDVIDNTTYTYNIFGQLAETKAVYDDDPLNNNDETGDTSKITLTYNTSGQLIEQIASTIMNDGTVLGSSLKTVYTYEAQPCTYFYTPKTLSHLLLEKTYCRQ